MGRNEKMVNLNRGENTKRIFNQMSRKQTNNIYGKKKKDEQYSQHNIEIKD